MKNVFEVYYLIWHLFEVDGWRSLQFLRNHALNTQYFKPFFICIIVTNLGNLSSWVLCMVDLNVFGEIFLPFVMHFLSRDKYYFPFFFLSLFFSLVVSLAFCNCCKVSALLPRNHRKILVSLKRIHRIPVYSSTTYIFAKLGSFDGVFDICRSVLWLRNQDTLWR